MYQRAQIVHILLGYATDHQIYVRQLYNGDWAVVLLNRNPTTSSDMTLFWSHIGLPDNQNGQIRDLWQHKVRL